MTCIPGGTHNKMLINVLFSSNWDRSENTYEPNDYLDGEDCGTIWTVSDSYATAGTWNDEECIKIYNYICKRMYLYEEVEGGGGLVSINQKIEV